MISGDNLFPIPHQVQEPVPWNMSNYRKLMECAAALPKGFQDLTTNGEISFNTAETVCRLVLGRDCADDRDLDAEKGVKGSALSHTEYRESYRYLVKPTAADNSLDKLLRLGLTMQIFIGGEQPPIVTAGLISGRIELSRQVPHYTPHTKSATNALIWIIVLALKAWRIHDTDLSSPQSKVLLDQLSQQFPSSVTSEGLMLILDDFGWEGYNHGMESLCREIESASAAANSTTFIAYRPPPRDKGRDKGKDRR
jgi:hypothetical protein